MISDKIIFLFFFILQAIKYLERMLIQDYCQQERENRCTIEAAAKEQTCENEDDEANKEKMDTSETKESEPPKTDSNSNETSLDDVEMTDANDSTGTPKAIKTEPDDGNNTTNDSEQSNDLTKESEKNSSEDSGSDEQSVQPIKMETDENGNDSNKSGNKSDQDKETDESINIDESTTDKDDPYSKDINIDPRTYCKLGHFHLLLEDYSKGMKKIAPTIHDSNHYRFFFIIYSNVSISKILRLREGTLARHGIFIWTWNGLLSLQRIQMVSI